MQQINFICSVVFLLLCAPAFVPDTFWKSSEWKGVVETLRLISWLVLALIPLLAGAVAICEERRLGLLEWQFSLPTSRLRQFLTKLFATYLLGLFLGALFPWLVDGLPTNDAADVLAMFPPALAQRYRGEWKPWYDAVSRW